MSFVFFSKLLPLFLYPVGLVCVLLVVALVLSWKRSRWFPIPVVLALVILLGGSNGWVSNWLVRSLEWQILPATDIPKADAIVILGGATKSASFPRPMVDVNEQGDRVLYGAQLYEEHKAPLLIAAGGRIDWLSSEQPEAADMAELLKLMGVPSTAIIQESQSVNTYQNAVNIKKILQNKGLHRVLLVTSAMHMPRSLLIFKRQGIEAIPAPTDFLISESELESPASSLQAVVLNLMPDAGRLDKTTRALKEYLGILIYFLRGWL